MQWLKRSGRHWLILTLVVLPALAAADDRSKAPSGTPLRLPVMDNEAAWQRLPKLKQEVADRRLPVWAKALAGPSPRTTAALLELDYTYRVSEAFDPRLRALMRWVAARANRCSYSQRYAEADLLRSGMTLAELERLPVSLTELSPKERAAVMFAEKLTLSADSVTDDEVARLIASFDEPQVVAMVLQLAYANFQDRLLLTLNATVEPDGPLPPLAVRFVAPVTGESIAAPRLELKSDKVLPPPTIQLGSEWTSVRFEQLRKRMELQRERPGRVSVPAWEEVHPRLPAGLYPPERPVRVQWSLVVLGHQPQMGAAWMKCLRTFAREANQDRVFEESLFWVITRTIDCFY